jgi:CRISPR-associated protein Cmr3
MSATVTRILTARDGFTIKDPRGFNVAGGVVGRTLPWPLPPTTAGAARTAIGAASGWLATGTPAQWTALLTGVAVAGPLAVVRAWLPAPSAWEALFPCPRDIVALPPEPSCAEGDPKALRLRWLVPAPVPASEGEVCGDWTGGRDGLATEALWRPRLPDRDKPCSLPSWWGREHALDWLLDPRSVEQRSKQLPLGWRALSRLDIHLAVDPTRSTARTGFLFGLETQETLARRDTHWDELGIWLRVRGGEHPALSRSWRFGGESRWATAMDPGLDPFAFPRDRYARHLAGGHVTRLRLLMMTPGVFAAGWRPDGFEATCDGIFLGRLDGLPDVDFTLRAAFVPRAGAVSGWDYAKRGPKTSRLFVPTGAVYYLEVSRPLGLDDFARLWLTTIQRPATQEARDGFGLVVPGLWPETL